MSREGIGVGGPLQPLKIVLVGDSSVGKTSLASRFSGDAWEDAQVSTINVGYCGLDLRIHGEMVPFDIWDTAGQEQFNAVIPRYSRSARGVMVVFDVTNRATFENVDKWVGLAREQADPVVLVFANKVDLEDMRTVQTAEAEEFCRMRGFCYAEGSAKSGAMVHEALDMLATKCVDHAREKLPEVLPLVPLDPSNRRCC
jgi:Ras-related protein Rab-11A